MTRTAAAAAMLASFLALGTAGGLIFGEIALGATVGLVSAIILVLPLFFVGSGRDSVLSLKGFFLFFRSGRG